MNNAGASVRENSCFDGLNRLTSTLVTTGTACTGTGAVSMTYDALGNITQKSDVCATANCFVYGGGGAGPHALTSIVGTYNGVANPTFTYDANGTMTAGAGRTVTATSFNMAATITDGANTAAFGYDPEHARYRMLTTGLNAGTTFYLNDPSSGAMEEESIVSGVTTWRDYIMVGGKMVAERFCSGAPPCGAEPTIDYFVLDHLGSIAVIVSSTGAVVGRLSYDAWGKRRNPDGSALSCTAGLTSPSSVTRGFTGQEMVDGLCLINFNARVYDPSLGRFMAADPVVGDETILQELNRYSYVLNDPLSLTDPSGMCGAWCIFEDILAVIVGIEFIESPAIDVALNNLLGISNVNASILGPIDAGIAGGITGYLATGGSLKGAALDALQAALFNAAGGFLKGAGSRGFFGIGHVPSEFIAHGLVGGLVSELRNGNFGSGFLAGGVSSLAPVPAGKQSWEKTFEGAIESAALGGLGSVLGGGKFENGAITGAFGYLFNRLLHLQLNGQNPTMLTCSDRTSSQTSWPVFSGIGACTDEPNCISLAGTGPIPPGTYYIALHGEGTVGPFLDNLRVLFGFAPENNWFDLISTQTNSDTIIVDGVTRGQFRLHPTGPIGVSEGCVSVCSGYSILRQQLLTTPMGTIPGTSTEYYGKLIANVPGRN